jgi:hypothetical protein
LFPRLVMGITTLRNPHSRNSAPSGWPPPDRASNASRRKKGSSSAGGLCVCVWLLYDSAAATRGKNHRKWSAMALLAPRFALERERKESDAAFCRRDKLRVSEINAFGRADVEIRFKNSTCRVEKMILSFFIAKFYSCENNMFLKVAQSPSPWKQALSAVLE